MIKYFVGLDLGQKQDYTALCIIEKVEIKNDNEYHVRYLKRYSLSTLYPDIVRDVKSLVEKEPLSEGYKLIVDATGVGIPILDMMREMDLKPIGIWITGGDSIGDKAGGWTVPKRDLVSNLQVMFESGNLKIAKNLKDTPVLMHELQNFKVKINIKTGHDSYEAWRESDNDDLVLSVALASWYAKRYRERKKQAVI